ncbi:sulfotransferase domain-containing protein [Geminicoccaceae bacterium 1502E]|nr:sulfotransferase domain-containing protein [Geminicoccaceae bacterium 1502E]
MLAVVKPAADAALKKATRWAVLGPLFWLPQDRKVRLERYLRGREQFQKLSRADAVVVSFGKSGRTWLRVMVSRFYQVKHGLSERVLIGFDNMHLRNTAIPRLFFTHDNYLKDFTGHDSSKEDYYGRKVVLLVRHPADVAVSQYHQWKFRMRPGKKTINDYPEHGREVSIFDFVAKEQAGLAKVVEFMNGWAREMPRLGEPLVVRYEDMRKDPAEAMRRLTAFLGTPGTEEQIEEAVRFASFENMRKMETQRTFWLSGGRMVPKDRSNPQSFKTRRGKVGGWRDYFSEEEAAEIDRLVDATLEKGFGYRSDETTAAAAAS